MGKLTKWRKKAKFLWSEWRADRAGRVPVPNNVQRAARDLTGPTGWVMSETWDHVVKDGPAYVKSFEPRIPPSLHISERDRVRAGQVIPVSERCIEDWGSASTDDTTEDPDHTATTEVPETDLS